MRYSVINRKTGLTAGVALLGALTLSACATKEYVNKEIGTLAESTQSQMAATDGRVSAHEAKLTQLDAATRQALERAEAAGKLAEGKLLYTMVLSDDGVKFPANRAELSPEAQERLTQLVQKLKAENKAVYLEIQGHTDSAGDAKYNEKLGYDRAEAVRKFLSQQGLPLSRMSTISYGEAMPAVPNTNRASRAQNRRVAVVVLS